MAKKASGPRFNIKMLSYQYRKSHYGDTTVVRSSYLIVLSPMGFPILVRRHPYIEESPGYIKRVASEGKLIAEATSSHSAQTTDLDDFVLGTNISHGHPMKLINISIHYLPLEWSINLQYWNSYVADQSDLILCTWMLLWFPLELLNFGSVPLDLYCLMTGWTVGPTMKVR